ESVQSHVVGLDPNWSARVGDRRLGATAGPGVNTSLRALEGQRLVDIHRFIVGSISDLDGVAGAGRVDRSLDGGVAGRIATANSVWVYVERRGADRRGQAEHYDCRKNGRNNF